MSQATEYPKRISCLDLIKHTLLDSFEFSAHSAEGLWSEYYLNGIGIDSFVGKINFEAVFSDLKNIGADKVIFAHTHPLANDKSLFFKIDEEDPRIKIAYGKKTLPLGNYPTSGDINLLKSLKLEGKASGIEVSGVVFAASGIWIFNVNDNISQPLNNPKNESVLDKVDPSEFLSKDLLIKNKFPDYFMEVEKPAMFKTRQQQGGLDTNLKSTIINSEQSTQESVLDNEVIDSVKQTFANQGITLEFIPYVSKEFDPVLILRTGIQDWEKKFQM